MKLAHVGRDQVHGMHAALEREVLRVDPEGVEADGLEHVVPAQALEASVHVGARERIDVAHVEPLGGGVGEHHQVVERVFGGGQLLAGEGVDAAFVPYALPLLLDVRGDVGLFLFAGHVRAVGASGACWRTPNLHGWEARPKGEGGVNGRRSPGKRGLLAPDAEVVRISKDMIRDGEQGRSAVKTLQHNGLWPRDVTLGRGRRPFGIGTNFHLPGRGILLKVSLHPCPTSHPPLYAAGRPRIQALRSRSCSGVGLGSISNVGESPST